MGKGVKAERELSNTLEDEYRFAAMPAGGSGSGTDRARPDVLATRRPQQGVPGGSGQTIVAEVKAWSDGLGQLDKSEIRALMSFATRAGGTAVVVVRPDRRTVPEDWHCYLPADLNLTESGNYSVRQAERPGRSLDGVVGDG